MNYKGKGEHSVNQLEQIIEELLEKQHEFNSRQFFTRSETIKLMTVHDINGKSMMPYSIEEALQDVPNVFKGNIQRAKDYLDKFYPVI